MSRMRVPGAEEWRGYEADLDTQYAHKLLFGRTIEEVVEYFEGGRSIERADELLFIPRPAFQYYVLAFVRFIESAKATGDSDAASSFLRLLINRENKDPGSVASMFGELEDAVSFVGQGQEHFHASIDIYGRLSELADELSLLVKQRQIAPAGRRSKGRRTT